VKYFKRI